MMWLLLSDGIRNKQQNSSLHSTKIKTNRNLCRKVCNKWFKSRRCLSCQFQRNAGNISSKTLQTAHLDLSQKGKLDGLWKKQSLYAFRAVSDSAFSTIIFEFFSRGLRVSCFQASPLLFVGSELFVGSLLGIFSVVANIIGIVERRAEESRKQQQFLENASAQLVADWDFSDSVEADLTSFDTFEIEEMVRWFEVLEELEGPGAMQFFQEVLLSDSVEKRVTLARCLGRCQTRSNILLCTLQQLAMKDSNSLVRNVARNSIRELIRHNVIPSPPLHLPENLSVFSMLNEEQSLRELSISYEKIPSGVFHVSGKSRITESNSDANLDSFLENSFTPFDRMDVLDIVTFCGLSSVIMGLQFYCLSHSVDLPFRFVALGWVFGVGGLIVYPRSGRLWQYLRRTTLLRSLFSELAMFS
ncbi:uncharacterized protein Gasu_47320 [Galdieria sulphuraria]|uniref:Uncharacterized protein n=1 Tax=Galdieria sulphuraria TaxID=130081 RepID=M2WUV1_GALSU|nr:uncharacterized protein Gasu_47320 [Galdieria sulphuraria]EME27745.1 hypothetical protein Gasu_47320 [Galdieria sulphuraria]|eukprot:XP_005704265.1 hypothetical protein Gasu_47320 [Galdieria sulphuraria]